MNVLYTFFANRSMKRIPSLLIVGATAAILGLFVGTGWTTWQPQETNYLVIEEFEIGPNMSVNDGTARLSKWVQALRATGKHSSVRLFFHDWGPEAAFYLVSETTDWGAIGTIFADVVAVEPDFMSQPFGFAGHSDNILTEIPVQ